MENEQIIFNNTIYSSTNNSNNIGTSDFNNGKQHNDILSSCKIYDEDIERNGLNEELRGNKKKGKQKSTKGTAYLKFI
jgi:hypothetical protein